MITQSETIGKIIEALTKAQMQFDPIIKDVKAHHHKFAPLYACYKSTRKALCDNGLSVIQQMNGIEGGRFIIETILGHISGEFFKSYIDLTNLLATAKGPNPLHTWGAVITYTRRYAYLAIIGAISEDEDDDGNALHSQSNRNSLSEQQLTDFSIIHDLLVKQLTELIKSSGCDVVEFTKFHNISSKDILTIKKSIDNFDELMVNFKNSNSSGSYE